MVLWAYLDWAVNNMGFLAEDRIEAGARISQRLERTARRRRSAGKRSCGMMPLV